MGEAEQASCPGGGQVRPHPAAGFLPPCCQGGGPRCSSWPRPRVLGPEAQRVSVWVLTAGSCTGIWGRPCVRCPTAPPLCHRPPPTGQVTREPSGCTPTSCPHPRAKSPILPPRCHLDADPGRAGRAGVLGSSSVPRSLSPRLHPAPSSDMHVLTWPHCASEKPQSWGAWLCVPTALGGARAPPSEPVPSLDLGTPHSGLPGGSRTSS